MPGFISGGVAQVAEVSYKVASLYDAQNLNERHLFIISLEPNFLWNIIGKTICRGDKSDLSCTDEIQLFPRMRTVTILESIFRHFQK